MKKFTLRGFGNASNRTFSRFVQRAIKEEDGYRNMDILLEDQAHESQDDSCGDGDDGCDGDEYAEDDDVEDDDDEDDDGVDA